MLDDDGSSLGSEDGLGMGMYDSDDDEEAHLLENVSSDVEINADDIELDGSDTDGECVDFVFLVYSF